MEAASAVSRLRARSFERECERLRPLAEAYVLRRFAGQLNRADAEDVVAEVLFRLHREVQAGRAPRNLRAMLLTSSRNAAIDLLRARAARPATVALEAAAEAPDAGTPPPERAESRERSARLAEALARMRDSYRETILLRFGLGLTVPEIAAHFQISQAAAKKRVLRAGAQLRKRMAAIEGEEFCPQMRELLRRSAFEREASSFTDEPDSEVLQAHFSHCGSCRSYLTQLRGELHELGSGALAALLAGDRLGGRVGVLHRLGQWAAAASEAAQGAGERLRHFALRASTPISSGDGTAGALMGAGQKIAAVCGAGAAATATCLLSGAVGPGIGAVAPSAQPPHRPPPKVRALPYLSAPPASVQSEPPTVGPDKSIPEPAAGQAATSKPQAAGEPAPAPPQAAEAVQPAPSEGSSQSEFGIQSGTTSPAASANSPPNSAGSAAAPPPQTRQAPAPATSRDSVGFQG